MANIESNIVEVLSKNEKRTVKTELALVQYIIDQLKEYPKLENRKRYKDKESGDWSEKWKMAGWGWEEIESMLSNLQKICKFFNKDYKEIIDKHFDIQYDEEEYKEKGKENGYQPDAF